MKKNFSLVIVALMVLMLAMVSAFTGCNNDAASDATTTTETKSQNDSKETAEETTKEDDDSIGLPLVGTGSSPEDPLFDPALGTVFTMYTTNSWAEDSKPDNGMVKEWIEARTGLQLNFIYTASDNYPEKMNLVWASGEEYDGFTQGNFRPAQQLLDDGYTVDLNPYMETYGKNFLRLLSDGFKFAQGREGELLALPKRVSNHRGWSPTIRVDWCEAAGLTGLPTTMDELEQYLDYVANNDANGNGDPTDEIAMMPVSSKGDYSALLYVWEGTFLGKDAYEDNYLSDGVVYKDYTHPNYILLLDKLRDWYSKGYIYPEYFTLTYAQSQDFIGADRVGMQLYWYSMIVRPFQAIEEADPTKTYAVLGNIESPVEGVESCYSEGNEYQPVIYASSTSKHPEAVVAYFDWMISDPTIDVTVWNGIEGEHWEWYNKDTLTYKVFPGSADRYFKGFQAVCQWEPKEQFVNVLPEEYVSQRYADFLQQLNDPARNYVEGFDITVPYTEIGTELEFLGNDAQTLIDENMLNYIIGAISRDDMLAAIEQYKEMYGNTYSEVYTEQYNAWINR